MFTLFQSVGTSLDCYDFSYMLDSGLATSSASSFRTHRCTSSGLLDLCTYWLLRWSWTWSSPTVGSSSFSQSLSFLLQLGQCDWITC